MPLHGPEPLLDRDDGTPTVVGVDVSLDDFSFFLGLVVGSIAGLVVGLVIAGIVVVLWL